MVSLVLQVHHLTAKVTPSLAVNGEDLAGTTVMVLMVWVEVTEEEEADTAVAPATKAKNATARAQHHLAPNMRANTLRGRTQEYQERKDTSMDVVVPEVLVDVVATAMDLAEDISGAIPVTTLMAIMDHAVHQVVLSEALEERHLICLGYSQV